MGGALTAEVDRSPLDVLPQSLSWFAFERFAALGGLVVQGPGVVDELGALLKER